MLLLLLNQDAVRVAMEDTSIDMSMVPLDTSFADHLLNLVNRGVISTERVDLSAARILQLKYDLDLFNNPMGTASEPTPLRTDEDLEAALQLCYESVVLLKNANNVLPIEHHGNGKEVLFL